MDSQHHEQHEQPGAEHRPLREYEYPDTEASMGPAPTHNLRAVPKQSRKGIWTAVIILVLLAIGIGAYFLFIKPTLDHTGTESAKTQDTAPATAKPQTAAPAPATNSNTVKSAKMNLELTLPSGWKSSEDPSTGYLRLMSPETTITTGSGSAQGPFVLDVRFGLDAGAVDKLHNSNAVFDSESIAYAAPTAAQYQYTSITVGGTNDKAGFLLVTSSDMFKKGEALARYGVNGSSYIIFGGFHRSDKTGLPDYELMPGGDFTSSAEYKAAVEAIRSLKIN